MGGILLGLAPQIAIWNTINQWSYIIFRMLNPPIEDFLATVLI